MISSLYMYTIKELLFSIYEDFDFGMTILELLSCKRVGNLISEKWVSSSLRTGCEVPFCRGSGNCVAVTLGLKRKYTTSI